MRHNMKYSNVLKNPKTKLWRFSWLHWLAIAITYRPKHQHSCKDQDSQTGQVVKYSIAAHVHFSSPAMPGVKAEINSLGCHSLPSRSPSVEVGGHEGGDSLHPLHLRTMFHSSVRMSSQCASPRDRRAPNWPVTCTAKAPGKYGWFSHSRRQFLTSMTSVLTSMTLLLTPGTDYPMDCTTLRDTATFSHTKFNVENVSMATLATVSYTHLRAHETA